MVPVGYVSCFPKVSIAGCGTSMRQALGTCRKRTGPDLCPSVTSPKGNLGSEAAALCPIVRGHCQQAFGNFVAPRGGPTLTDSRLEETEDSFEWEPFPSVWATVAPSVRHPVSQSQDRALWHPLQAPPLDRPQSSVSAQARRPAHIAFQRGLYNDKTEAPTFQPEWSDAAPEVPSLG